MKQQTFTACRGLPRYAAVTMNVFLPPMGAAHTATGGLVWSWGNEFIFAVMRNLIAHLIKTPQSPIMLSNMTSIFVNKYDI
jgi:hypothetical protein